MTAVDPVAAVVPQGSLRTSSLPEALSIREAALAALGIARTAEEAVDDVGSLLHTAQEDVGTTTNDQRPTPDEQRRKARRAPSAERRAIGSQHGARSTARGAEAERPVAASLDSDAEDLLEAARQVLAAYRQQIAAHRTAVLVEDAWAVVRHTPTASQRELAAANRRRLRARRAFRADWETYLHRTERLCHVAERVLGLEGAEPAGR